ncbi:Serine/threonine-protein kinase SRPK [Scenedesmus sp. PABB004]|nr:Serine/threonine-protein kinase SRPK [Scenedesmus sp. PABB004]
MAADGDDGSAPVLAAADPEPGQQPAEQRPGAAAAQPAPEPPTQPQPPQPRELALELRVANVTRQGMQLLESLLTQWAQWHHSTHPESYPGGTQLLRGSLALDVDALYRDGVVGWRDTLAPVPGTGGAASHELPGEAPPQYDRGTAELLAPPAGAAGVGMLPGGAAAARRKALAEACLSPAAGPLGGGESPASAGGAKRRTLPNQRCFNCGSYGHGIAACPAPHDRERVAAAKAERTQGGAAPNPSFLAALRGRYFTEPRAPGGAPGAPGGAHDDIKPGVLTPELAAALGMGSALAPPPWLARMAALGVPPAWRTAARADGVEDGGGGEAVMAFVMGDSDDDDDECELPAAPGEPDGDAGAAAPGASAAAPDGGGAEDDQAAPDANFLPIAPPAGQQQQEQEQQDQQEQQQQKEQLRAAAAEPPQGAAANGVRPVAANGQAQPPAAHEFPGVNAAIPEGADARAWEAELARGAAVARLLPPTSLSGGLSCPLRQAGGPGGAAPPHQPVSGPQAPAPARQPAIISAVAARPRQAPRMSGMAAKLAARRVGGKPAPKGGGGGQKAAARASPPYSSDDFSDRSDGGDSDVEDEEDYRKGGYHPVHVGEKFKQGRYLVLRKLGWGHFSTVWLVLDHQTRTFAALKVQKSATHYTEAARDEITLLSQIRDGDPGNAKHCCRLLDSFEHAGPHGLHVCMVFEVLGDNLLALIKAYDYRGVPLTVVRALTRQMLVALDYLHRELSIIHTDFKPENASASADVTGSAADGGDDDDGDGGETESRQPAANGAANGAAAAPQQEQQQEQQQQQQPPAQDALAERQASGQHASSTGGAPPAPAPPPPPATLVYESRVLSGTEALSGARAVVVDFGNACWTHKHFTDDIQTRQYRSPEVILGAKYGPPADMWSLACVVFELATGDFLFEPKSGSSWDRDEDHIALMMELLGRPPRRVWSAGKYARDYFNRSGELRHIKKLKFWDLPSVLLDKYRLPRAEAAALADFLLPLLAYDPAERATAAQALRHPWLDGPPAPGGGGGGGGGDGPGGGGDGGSSRPPGAKRASSVAPPTGDDKRTRSPSPSPGGRRA